MNVNVKSRSAFCFLLSHHLLPCLVTSQAVVGNGPLGVAVETELEFVRAEGCDEGFPGEVRRYCCVMCYVFDTVSNREVLI